MSIYNKKNKLWIAWVLILPVLLIRGFTTIYPFIVTLRNSFYNIRILKGVNEFAGISNYIKVFSDKKVQTSIEFTLIFVVVSMIGHIIFGVALALILNMKTKWRRFIRTIVLIPWAMPESVVGIAAKWAFNDKYGLVNDFVRRFVDDFSLNWLINTDSSRIAVIAVDLWRDLPFFAILVLSGLQFISADLYEAAKVDGANTWQVFRYVTLPLLKPMTLFVVITSIISYIQAYVQILIMTEGGPGTSTYLASYIIYDEAFVKYNFGYASALSFVMFVVTAALTGLSFKVSGSDE